MRTMSAMGGPQARWLGRLGAGFRAGHWGKVAAALVGTAALAGTATSVSLGGFSAAVTHPNNAAGSGTLVLKDGVGSTTCLSTGSGATSSTSVSTNDNSTCPSTLFAGTNLEPGGSSASATVTLTNVGSLAASSLTLAPGTCTVSDNTSPGGSTNVYFGTDTTGFCGKLDVTIENDTGTPSCVFPSGSTGTCPAPSSSDALSTLTSQALPGLTAGASATYKVTVALDASATNADQGLLATVPLTWTLNQ